MLLNPPNTIQTITNPSLARFCGHNAESSNACYWGCREQGLPVKGGRQVLRPATSPPPLPQGSATAHGSSSSSYHCLPTGDGHRALSFFQQKGLRDFDTLLLSSDGNTLYVGAREAILALNIQNPGVPRLRNMVRRPGTRVQESSFLGPAESI